MHTHKRYRTIGSLSKHKIYNYQFCKYTLNWFFLCMMHSCISFVMSMHTYEVSGKEKIESISKAASIADACFKIDLFVQWMKYLKRNKHAENTPKSTNMFTGTSCLVYFYITTNTIIVLQHTSHSITKYMEFDSSIALPNGVCVCVYLFV